MTTVRPVSRSFFRLSRATVSAIPSICAARKRSAGSPTVLRRASNRTDAPHEGASTIAHEALLDPGGQRQSRRQAESACELTGVSPLGSSRMPVGSAGLGQIRSKY